LFDGKRFVIVINNQFTNSTNATQLASGAGRSSAAGNNAAIAASNTLQQQAVGAKGEANNTGQEGTQTEPHVTPGGDGGFEEEGVAVLNNQKHKSTNTQGAVTQVASGGGVYSAAGTNAAIESSNTKQQHAVGGDAAAANDGMNSDQTET
jgi:hypothetical protein